MKEFKYIFGPVPSRRLGRSLGVSPIPPKTCNYSCVYCQLGRTGNMTGKRKEFFPLSDILKEFDTYLSEGVDFDVVSIVGDGEPTLYSKLGELISEIKKRISKPLAVITNGALLYDEEVRDELFRADIVLPSLDAYDEASFRRIDRPLGSISFEKVFSGLTEFSNKFSGRLFMEIMLASGINDDSRAISEFKKLLSKIKYERVYINAPVRPPAEEEVRSPERAVILKASEILGGIPIDELSSESFESAAKDSYEAVLEIIARHPMADFEIEGFLNSRGEKSPQKIFDRLRAEDGIVGTCYGGHVTYRTR